MVTDDTGSAALSGLVGSDPPGGFVDAGVDIAADVIISGSSTAGGPVGAGGHIDLGDGFSMTVQDNAFSRQQPGPRGIRGVPGGAAESLSIEDNGSVFTQFLLDMSASLSDASALTLFGGGVGSVNNSVIDLATDWTGSITWPNFDITGSTIFNSITVGGAPAVAGVNVLVDGDGSSSVLTLVPEPTSAILLVLGVVMGGLRKRA